MSRFIESIKVEDQKAYLLDLHQERVDRTLQAHGVRESFSLEKIFKELGHAEDGLFKMRVVYDLYLNYSVQLIPYAFSEIAQFRIVTNNEIDYTFKGEDRKAFEEMKNNAKTEEIIIVKNNHITDTSYSNLLFLKDEMWYTPNTYLLNGVQRQHLLKENKIKETEITLENIREFTHFQLINAMNEFDDSFIYSVDTIINFPRLEKEYYL